MSSNRKERFLALARNEYNGLSELGLQDLARKTLENGVHGLCFSPYVKDQQPGDVLDKAAIRERLAPLAPFTKAIRSFSCTEGNEFIPELAKEMGFQTLVGAWLGPDLEKNEAEIDGLVALAKAGYVDLAAVGNEVMYRGDLTENQLLEYIRRVKEAIPHIQVGYVDAYYEFTERPRITAACDVVFANCYPFWEGCDHDYALLYMKDMFRQAQRAAKGKKVIISETGWPSKGTSLEGAFPSYSNYLKYFVNTQKWSDEDAIEVYYFSAFDEAWKVGDEGDVGAHWGLWDMDGLLKF
jgi:exo-beta-1,3-glucanase (GH17 family)